MGADQAPGAGVLRGRDAQIAMAPTKAAREKLIKELPRKDPHLHSAFVEALRAASGASASLRHGGRFPLCGRGDINTYAVFAELGANAINPEGRMGTCSADGNRHRRYHEALLWLAGSRGSPRRSDRIRERGFHLPSRPPCLQVLQDHDRGVAKPKEESRIGFYIRHFSELSEAHVSSLFR